MSAFIISVVVFTGTRAVQGKARRGTPRLERNTVQYSGLRQIHFMYSTVLTTFPFYVTLFVRETTA